MLRTSRRICTGASIARPRERECAMTQILDAQHDTARGIGAWVAGHRGTLVVMSRRNREPLKMP